MKKSLLEEAAAFYGVRPDDLQAARGGNVSEVYFAKKNEVEFALRITPP